MGEPVKTMLFVLWYQFEPEHAHQVLELWKHFKFPSDVNVLQRYLLVGRHMSVAIFEAPDERSLLKITAPFSSYGVAHVAPAMPLEEAIKAV
ncbi:hypothetical protein MchiMG62_06200 [Methanoculleus chikugoensis]|uniref:DUF3303 domain-containing protein n=2 Tax=Methanoculleus chikugoensis TaxID=118126 RepID=A0ABM7H3U2_9EURY|nr:hypothetical protein MchiMG62_06200 [Methanoculleus chikugoensis]